MVVWVESRENAGVRVEGGVLDDAEKWEGIGKMEEQMWGKRFEGVGMVVGLGQMHRGITNENNFRVVLYLALWFIIPSDGCKIE